MPILGILASSKLIAAAGGDYESIASTTVGAGGVSSVNFTGISSSYAHLQLRCLIRLEAAANYQTFRIQLGNGSVDAGFNYAFHSILGNGSAVSAQGSTSQSGINLGLVTADNAPANTYGVTIIDILDYANTNKLTTVRALTGFDTNADQEIQFASGLWNNTAAVNYIRCRPAIAGDIKEGSVFSLYGIKGA